MTCVMTLCNILYVMKEDSMPMPIGKEGECILGESDTEGEERREYGPVSSIYMPLCICLALFNAMTTMEAFLKERRRLPRMHMQFCTRSVLLPHWWRRTFYTTNLHSIPLGTAAVPFPGRKEENSSVGEEEKERKFYRQATKRKKENWLGSCQPLPLQRFLL